MLLVLELSVVPNRVLLEMGGPLRSHTFQPQDLPLPAALAVIGPPGPTTAAGSSALVRTAESSVSGHRAVAASADGRVSHVGNRDQDAANCIGLSLNAAAAGGQVQIETNGEVEHSGWTWSAGPVWLGDNGVLTQVLPTEGLLLRMGIATAPTRLNVNPHIIAQL